jgi:uncharacterized membrane protein YjjP (DUF1212 family)
MTSETMATHIRAGESEAAEQRLRLLQLAARMLLEYNFRSSVLVTRLEQLARNLGVDLEVGVSYRAVALYLAEGRCIHVQAREYLTNVDVSAGILRVIEATTSSRMAPWDAITQLELLEHAEPAHPLTLLAALFGLAAAALAAILHADYPALAIVAFSSTLGLLARKALARQHWPLFSLPFVAGGIGGMVGGMGIRLGWTQTPALCVMVPALMLVPGPHLINGLYDIFENHIQTGVSRLVLAGGILISAAIGSLFGAWSVMDLNQITPATSDAVHLTLILDVVLAAVASCGFGAFYNSPWRVLWISIFCGMAGHGVRFLLLDSGVSLPGATLLACITIGVIASVAVNRFRLPFSSVAFAGAVPMMPGTLIYRSIAGAARLSLPGNVADPELAAGAVSQLMQATLVVGAMAAGLLLGAFAASFMSEITRVSRDRARV